MGLRNSGKKTRFRAGFLITAVCFLPRAESVFSAPAQTPELTRLRGVSMEKAAYREAREARVSELVNTAEKYLQAKDCPKFFQYAVAIKKMGIARQEAEFVNMVCGGQSGMLAADAAVSAEAAGETVGLLLEWARGCLKRNQIDQAVEALERVFLIDADNAEASKMIDGIRDEFVAEARQELKKRGELGKQRFAEYVEGEFSLAEDLIAQEMYMDARMILNRILLIDKDNARARRMMRKLNRRVGES